MSRSCHTPDQQLFEFAQGQPIDIDVDAHIATCDECQDYLGELWSGSLDRDISEPVIKALRLELWVIEIAKAGFDIAGRMGKAAGTYLGDARDEDA